MKKILLLIIVQTLFKYGFSQNTEVIYLPVAGDSLRVNYTPTRAGLIVSQNTLEAVFYVCESMSCEISSYEELVAEYDRADSIQLLQELQLKEIIMLKDDQVNAYRTTTANLNTLLTQTITASNTVLQDNLKLRIQKRWFLIGGIGVGLAGGLLLASFGN